MAGSAETFTSRLRSPRAAATAGALVLCVGVLAGRPGGLPAQEPAGEQSRDEGRCDLLRSNYVRSIVTAGGSRINYVSGPVLLECRDGLRVEADSVVEFTANRFRQLFGDVMMDGPDTRLQADRVHHYADVGRVRAWGDVDVFEKADSMRLVGDTLRLLRANRFREEDRLSVWGEGAYAVMRFGRDEGAAADSVPAPPDSASVVPDSVAVVPDSAAVVSDTLATPPDSAPAPSVASQPRDTVYARRIHLRGRSRFAAAGSVRIVSDEMVARSDSADYSRDRGVLSLIPEGPAARSRVVGEAYELTSRTMDVRLGEGGIRRVEAREDAVLSGEDIRLTAPVVRIFLLGGQIDRLVAVREAPAGEDEERTEERRAERAPDSAAADSAAPARPEAVAEAFHLRADSIEVMAPGERLETVFAAGDARGESLGRDSLNTPETPEIARTDWIEGDSILATFIPTDSVAAPEAPPSADAPASADAEPDSARARFRLDRLVADGNARSLYRLVRRDTTAAPPDTAGAPPDTASASADTVVVPVAPDSAAAPGASGGNTARARSETPPLAIHYVTGRRITIQLDHGEVREMEVDGQTRGLYLEPGELRPRGPVADTSAAPAGQLGARSGRGAASPARNRAPASPGASGSAAAGRRSHFRTGGRR